MAIDFICQDQMSHSESITGTTFTPPASQNTLTVQIEIPLMQHDNKLIIFQLASYMVCLRPRPINYAHHIN